MRLMRWTAAVLVGTAVVTGCSAGDDSDPAPVAASSSPATPAESATSEPAESAGLDACDLLGPADYNRFIRADLRGSTSEGYGLDGELGTMNLCVVSSAQFSILTFGYSTDPDAWSTIERRTRPDPEPPAGGDEKLRGIARAVAQKRVDVPAVGEGAFFASGFGWGALYAVDQGVSFMISPSYLVPAGGGITVADYVPLMVNLLVEASSGVDSDPIQLPPQCPAVDSPEVVAVLGEVTHARGAAFKGKAPSCDYLAADGRTLSAGSTFYGTATNFTDARLPAEVPSLTILDPPPGLSSGIRREGRGWRYHSALPARLETVGVWTGRADWAGRPTTDVDREDFLAFVDAYRALASDQLGVQY